MKLPKAFSIAITFLLLMSQMASAQKPQCLTQLKNLTVTAFTDGRDLLYITNNALHWHHLDFAPPGWWGSRNWPTGLIMNHSKKYGQNINWIPQWVCPPENPGCYSLEVDSSELLMGLRLPPKYQVTDIQVIQARESISVYQYPAADNQYTTIIDFNDDGWGGADWYQVKLTFAPAK
jgi:hypothetical protein